MTSLGIDIGGGSVKVAAVADGRVRWMGQSGRYANPTGEQLIGAAREAVAGKGGPFTTVGLCVPGLVDEQKRQVVRSVNFPGLEGLPLIDLATGATGQQIERVFIAGDAYATAYDLFVTRRLTGRLFLLALGTGVGAAVLDDGRPLFVDGESPGHFGQLDVSIEGEPVLGPDGGAGSLEGYVGAAALARRYGPNFYHLLDRLPPDDPPVRALARAVRIAHGLYRPHHVCLAGGIGARFAPLLPALREQIATNLTNIARPDWSLTTGDHDFHAAAGVARLAALGGWPPHEGNM